MYHAILQKAGELGFIATGFSRPGRPLYFDFFKAWIEAGKQADMAWMARSLDLRENPGRLLEGCRSVISLAFPYPSRTPATPEGYTISRYAQPDKEDYHDRLRRRGKELIRLLKNIYGNCRSRILVDSAPILERSIAFGAGIGFIGRNNSLIVPGYGSYLYLAEVLTTAPIDFPPVDPMENRCGSCRQCIEACPTGALEKPFSLNAARCLSYLTIECQNGISAEDAEKMGRCFFGCDRCQEVCPFNKEGTLSEILLPPADTLLNMSEQTFRERFGKTALSRPGLEKWKSNLRAVLGDLKGSEA